MSWIIVLLSVTFAALLLLLAVRLSVRYPRCSRDGSGAWLYALPMIFGSGH